jgi:hypothetical protein
MNFNIAIIVSFLFLADYGAAQVLDISKFGGSPNSDITQVLIIHIELTFRKYLFHLLTNLRAVYMIFAFHVCVIHLSILNIRSPINSED